MFKFWNLLCNTATPPSGFSCVNWLLNNFLFYSRAINRRFQRLESHVVTLARSVAHLSSELRSHNSIVHELEALRKEVREMKEQQFISNQQSDYMANGHSDFDKFRGWVPSLTNPKRINKLTK